jgi:hypothetical protein
MAQHVSLAKAERMQTTIDRQREKLREGARLGGNALIASLGGGIGAGFLNKKYPTIWGTTISSAGALGTVLIMGAMGNFFADYSDEAAALGSGLLASAIAKEAENYFDAAA